MMKKAKLKNTLRYSFKMTLLSSIVLAELSSPSYAQTSNMQVILEEVQVTGRKKSDAEAIQDVPIAISAFSGEQLEAKFIYDLEGLSYSMPNVSLDDIGTANGIANFSIRGLGINSSIPSIDPTVGVFVDGMYLGITSGVIYDFFDLEGIEVLRGPQGTLFGRNVTGGAILLKTAKPTDEFSAKIKTGVEKGSEGISNKTVAASINGSLIEEQLSAKLSLYQRDNDGWHKNLATGEQFGEEEVSMARVALDWTPADNISIVTRLESGKMDTQGPAAQNRGFYNKNSFDFAVGTEGFGNSEWSSLVIEYQQDVEFGDGTITNILGWRDYSSHNQSDIDGSADLLFDATFKTYQDQLSNEFRYAGQFYDSLDITAGLYWFTQDITYFEHRLIAPPNGPNAAMGGEQEQSTYAIFTQIDYAVSADHILTAGLRYSREEKAADVATFSPANSLCDIDAEVCDFDFSDEQSWSYATYKLGYQWLLSENAQLYLSYSTAVRAGGYNLRSTDPTVDPGPFDEETSSNREFGLKSSWLDNRVRANFAVFQNRIKDLQREINVPNNTSGITQKILNAADATINGIEIEFQALLSDSLLATATFGTLEGSYSKVYEDLNRDGTLDQSDLDLEIPRLSPTSMSFGLIYDTVLGDFANLNASLNYSHRDESYYTDSNNGRINAADMVDASLTLKSLNDTWQASLYGKNLNDQAVNGGDTILPFGPGQTFSPLNEGRTFGVDISYQF